MKRIYLDQNKWIDLARAQLGQPGSDRFRDVLALAEARVKNGSASFPLSAMHYIEIAKRRNHQSRSELASTMASLSRYHTMAPFTVMVPPEIDRALRRRFEVEEAPRDAQLFGVGFEHAMNRTYAALPVPAEGSMPPGLIRGLEALGFVLRESIMLAGLPPDAGIDESAFDAWQEDVGNGLAEGQERLRLARRGAGLHRGERSQHLAKYAALENWRSEFSEALGRAKLNWDDVLGLGQEGIRALVDDIPMIHVGSELERQRESTADKPWDPHDVNDVYHLIAPVAYCDIVITERQWVDSVKRSRLDERYGTLMLSDLTKLAEQLA